MMKSNFLLFFAALSITFFTSCGGDDEGAYVPEIKQTPESLNPIPITKTNQTKLYMHYMPWFETKESSGNNQWGYHWKMNNKNPDIIDANGKRQIASHYYPLIGPYHSGDKEVIENHLLMMKYAGVDGVLIDWYGSYNLYDYAVNKENSEQLIAMLDKVGLEYAIVYEDRTLTNIVNASLATSTVNAAKADLAYMQSNYFGDANYIKINNKPLLLNFGPITLTTPAQWTNALVDINPKPTLLTLWYESNEAGTNASGEYSWVYQNNTQISNFYNNRLPNLGFAIGSAYPGFDDFYVEGGVGNIIGWTINHNNGATLDATLSMATNAGVGYLQLITWNDFGEGTMIEPTVEFEYSYVQKIKTFAGVQDNTAFNEISKLYNLRQQYQGNAAVQTKLDKAFGYFVSMQPTKAIAILNEL